MSHFGVVVEAHRRGVFLFYFTKDVQEKKKVKIGFDNDKYLKTQSAHIRERITSFGGKLYLEFGGKIFDDYHASRVLPGFLPDSKMKMLLELAN